ncbi:hypothetical protein [Leifsonia shinshuensis]|uniref:Uncharacterized protein n=1 Tax=Leifsonia shinshuensis TaxID=150026 RepID=A0A853D0B6_9MICO|nr:hypothetical protein [Leifsonia shinshuensis]NYJ24971.1 hypothetical protein [Leifsonia shinshuensis]
MRRTEPGRADGARPAEHSHSDGDRGVGAGPAGGDDVRRPPSAASATAAAGAAVQQHEWTPATRGAVQYADLRAGGLTCEYRGEAAKDTPWLAPDVFVGVLPTLGANDAFGVFANTAGVPVDDDHYFGCLDWSGSAAFCEFGAIVGDYQVIGSVRVLDRAALDEAAVRTVFTNATAVVGRLGAPAPLWQPAGGSLRGVTAPDGFLPLDRIAAALGVASVNTPKEEGGEYTTTQLASAQLSGSYWTDFNASDNTAGVAIAVLPGGASYYDDAKRAPLPGTGDITPVPGLGDAAYLSTFRDVLPSGPGSPVQYLDVKVKNSWLQLSGASPAVLERLGREVIANLS